MSCSPASCGQVIIAGAINQTCWAIQILLTEWYLLSGINMYLLDVMLISELWQGSVTAWGWPHRDIPCPHASLRWSLSSPDSLSIAIVISEAQTTPSAHSEQQPTIKCGSDRENKSWAPGEEWVLHWCAPRSIVTLHSLWSKPEPSILYWSLFVSLMISAWSRRWAHVKLQTVSFNWDLFENKY